MLKNEFETKEICVSSSDSKSPQANQTMFVEAKNQNTKNCLMLVKIETEFGFSFGFFSFAKEKKLERRGLSCSFALNVPSVFVFKTSVFQTKDLRYLS